eukprot:Rmarinus@m.22937
MRDRRAPSALRVGGDRNEGERDEIMKTVRDWFRKHPRPHVTPPPDLVIPKPSSPRLSETSSMGRRSACSSLCSPGRSPSRPCSSRASRPSSRPDSVTSNYLDGNYLAPLPTDSEVAEYARYLGMDPLKEPEYLWLAKEALCAALPFGWSEHVDPSDGTVYYYCNQTDESQWEHPLDEYYRWFYRMMVEYSRESKAAVQIQRVVRGHLVRKELRRTARVPHSARGKPKPPGWAAKTFRFSSLKK